MTRKEVIGNATLYLGDCLEVLSGFQNKEVDAVITDPPYGATSCKWDSPVPLEPMWCCLKRVVKASGAIVMTCSQPFTSVLVSSNLKMFRYEMIWKKERPTNPLLCKKQPPKYHENIVVFYDRQPAYNVQLIRRQVQNKRNNSPRNYKDSTKTDTGKYSDMVLSGRNDFIYQPSVLSFPMERGIHPTQKPVKLMEYLIKSFTDHNETVLDFTMGSGSTGVACHRQDRSFIGIEIEEKYFDIACGRIEKAQRQQILFPEGI